MTDELRKKGRRHGRKGLGRLMKAAGLCGRQKGRYRVQTTDSRHDRPIAPNRLAQVPKATAPNQLWVADIPGIETQEGWLYLAAILDLYSRKTVGWAMIERNRHAARFKSFGDGPSAPESASQFAFTLRSWSPIRQR